MNATRQPLRTGIIGYGQSGRLSHAYPLRKIPEFAITAVCDASPENRRRAQEELGCAVYASHQELLAKESLDLVSVVTRSDTHCSITCDCLQAGVDAVVTKPWALDASEARRMLAAQASSGRRIFPWIPIYWAPDYRMLSNLLEQETIGDVFLIRRYYTDFRRRTDWQTERQYGGGYLLNWGMHILQPVLALARSPLRRVFGQLLQTVNPGDAEDNFLAIMEFENGIRGVAEFTESLFGLPSFLIQGTRGTILAETDRVVVRLQDPADPETAESTEHPLVGKIFGDEAEIYADVARTLLSGTPFPVSPETALQGTLAVDAVRQSHEQKQIVELD